MRIHSHIFTCSSRRHGWVEELNIHPVVNLPNQAENLLLADTTAYRRAPAAPDQVHHGKI
jgi:hypothetical protein